MVFKNKASRCHESVALGIDGGIDDLHVQRDRSGIRIVSACCH